ncbi:MAG: asparagine synthase (glutamine-hydrolyzing) [Flavobacteriales bacterium CG_4_10_14_0_2_um_filter_32_8]|nr:MAG: asparagine synthase (glutamine-hydrolyzing) [Flavobacteriales bacterium CG_4_10_14_0_2_um_filter_32_8]
MCGISGIVALKTNKRKLLESLPTLMDAIKHRGPDDEGCSFFSEKEILCTFGNDTPEKVKNSKLPYSPIASISDLDNNYFLGLGHRRLSIMDHSECGHQPMCDKSKNYWIVFNGEIYNYQSIKIVLEKLGHQFITQTDTEVLLNAYIEWGEECLLKLNGMWSFVLYDCRKNELFGARDRFGVKPFYYVNNEECFAFSSEIKSLIRLPNFEKKINPLAVYDYLVTGKLEVDDESFFKGIYELKPAHNFSFNLTTKTFKKNKYYELSYNKQWEAFDTSKFNKLTDVVFQKVYQAVKTRLRADVEIGTCLSGGLDSTIITCVINDIKNKKKDQNEEVQELFTAIYPDNSINEEHWAELVSKATNTNWNKTCPNAKDLKEQLEDLVYYQDIPFTSSSSFSQYKVMELVSKTEVKVTLDGQGADELFGGYSPHYVASVFNSLKKFSCSSFFNNINGQKSNFSNRSLLYLLPLKYNFSKLFQNSYQKRLIQSQPELNYINKKLWNDNSERIELKNDEFSCDLNKLLAHQFTQNKLKHLLRLADRNAMRFSIESRTPFVDDYELVEFVFNQSGAYKIRNSTSKYLLREAFKKLIPKEIYERKDKIGFATPENEWLKELKPIIKEMISEQKNDEFVDWAGFNENFESIYDNALKTNTQRLWRLINFAIWKKVYQV